MTKPWLVRVGAFLYLQAQEKAISMVDDCFPAVMLWCPLSVDDEHAFRLPGTNCRLFTVNVTFVLFIFLVDIFEFFLVRYGVKTQYSRYSRRYAHEEWGGLGIMRKFPIGILCGINAAASGELHYLHTIGGENAARRYYFAFKHFHYFGVG
ncbi:hypothetical protein V476_05660 [Pseudomonas syringae KCTC 12500]|nr:hypothetical protein V476_05660 [Pseudomonas syringae KCTC 12500]POR86586.1 hypothetical protein BKM21_05900 [Pseudomonas syringae pv. syringae]